MTEKRNNTPKETPELRFVTKTLAARKPTRFDFYPDAPARAAMATALGLIEVPALRLAGELRPVGRHDFELVADLTARAVQPCSVTLAPVPCTLSEAVHRRFVADFSTPESDEVEMGDEETDPLPEILDIAEIATEALALALPQYPRAPGVELGEAVFAGPGVAPLSDADLRPFSGLAALAAKLKKPDSGSSSGG